MVMSLVRLARDLLVGIHLVQDRSGAGLDKNRRPCIWDERTFSNIKLPR